jgi:spermidine synthase
MSQQLQQARHLAQQHLWPLRVNRLAFIGRRLTNRWVLVHRGHSSITGPVTVWDLGRERRLAYSEGHRDTTQSVMFTRGSWAQIEREYWGRALRPPRALPPHPRVLIAGLGGGTMVHLAARNLSPAAITVIELDPEVVATARTQLGLDSIDNVRYLTGDVFEMLAALSSDETFDLIVEDIFFDSWNNQAPGRMEFLVDQLTSRLTPGGSLVANRWFAGHDGKALDAGQAELERLLTDRGFVVRRTKVKQRWFNELVFAHRR